MVSIVVHGILGTSYGKTVLVDDGMEKGDLEVLSDLRHKLAYDYRDSANQIGWFLQPAPSGIWLCRMELAFDVNTTPAYLIVAFMIPRGKQLNGSNVLDQVDRIMVSNHSAYIRNNVIVYDANWSFLNRAKTVIEGSLVESQRKQAPYVHRPETPIAYYKGTLAMMLESMWCENFAHCGAVFCGKTLLADMDFPKVVANDDDNMTGVEENLPPLEEIEPEVDVKQVNVDPPIPQFVRATTIPFSEHPKVYGPPVVENPQPIRQSLRQKVDSKTINKKKDRSRLLSGNGWWILVCGILAGFIFACLLEKTIGRSYIKVEAKIISWILWLLVYGMMMLPLVKNYLGERCNVRRWQLAALITAFLGVLLLLIIQTEDFRVDGILACMYVVMLIPAIKMEHDAVDVEKLWLIIGVLSGGCFVGLYYFIDQEFPHSCLSFTIPSYIIWAVCVLIYMMIPVLERKAEEKRLLSFTFGLLYPLSILAEVLMIFNG